MDYATPEDMLARFGKREMIALTDREANAQIDTAILKLALEDAQVYVDGYIGQVYRLPLKGCAKPALPDTPIEYAPPPMLSRMVCDIARYFLHGDLAPEHEVYRRYLDATNQLKAIVDGRVLLACTWGGSAGEPLGRDAQTGVDVQFGFSPRAFDDDQADNYA